MTPEEIRTLQTKRESECRYDFQSPEDLDRFWRDVVSLRDSHLIDINGKEIK